MEFDSSDIMNTLIIVIVLSYLLHTTTVSSYNTTPPPPNNNNKHNPLSSSSSEKKGGRNYNTPADRFYQKHERIPLPQVTHANLKDLIIHDDRIDGDGTTRIVGSSSLKHTINSEHQPFVYPKQERKNILVIGDVHGCLNELKTLIKTAIIKNNDGQLFTSVVLVGDLVNKGPQSAEVIRYVRTQKYWYSVRGNHDDGALAAALGDLSKRNKEKYKWILGEEKEEQQEEDAYCNNNDNRSFDDDDDDDNDRIIISDEDVQWLAELPYTILIPTHLFESSKNANECDRLIVHAGLMPNIPLHEQNVEVMITVREIVQSGTTTGISTTTTTTLEKEKSQYTLFHKKSSMDNESNKSEPKPWASIWNGPYSIIFGHDARRGLQLHPNAIGLDTGAVYGKQLTGIILPKNSFVSVDAEEVHSPIA